MSEFPFSSESSLVELVRGTITAADDKHGFTVRVRAGDQSRLLVAGLLITSATTPRLRPGDSVLCWIENDDPVRMLILGRIGTAGTPSGVDDCARPEIGDRPVPDCPEALVIEAKHELTLRVGDGSITIREDGKILIKGKDLVSHAQRMNRIKGGSVSIN